MKNFVKGGLAVLLGLSLLAMAGPALAQLGKTEIGCASKLAKAAGKVASTVAKTNGKCRDSDISGKAVGSCPDAKGGPKIQKTIDKLIATAEKSCASTCTGSEFPCISDQSCPARAGNNLNTEFCSGGGSKVFDARKLGFPGAYCDALTDGDLSTPTEIGECSSILAARVGDAILEGVYGSITNSDNLNQDEAKCLAAAGKAVAKYVSSGHKAIVKCRDGLRSGKLEGFGPLKCSTADPKTVSALDKADAGLVKSMGKCADEHMAKVDFCGNGQGGTVSVADAIECLRDWSLSLIDQPQVLPVNRAAAVASLLDATEPPPAYCGDNSVNQLPNAFVLNGEECDGTDDSACPGLCLPPGDNFQCTCSDVKRSRFLATGVLADLDNGWTGFSHGGTVSDRSGFVLEVANCDCDVMDGMDCVGSTGDSVCDRFGQQLPTCSWDLGSGTSCDQHGNQDGNNIDADCQVCGPFAGNAGTSCDDSRDCQLQCIDENDTVVGSCNSGQSQCPAGSVCRGACDPTATCVQIPLGAPLPLVSAGNATCLQSQFREDIYGTVDILTGENATYMQYRTIVSNPGGLNTSTPCPVCGGFCVGGGADGDPCQGTCSVSGDECRFDTDCPGGETCTESSNECTGGGRCELGLICNGGQRAGLPCRFEAATLSFGTPSNDCLPEVGTQYSPVGTLVNFLPSTSEQVTLPATIPCTASGFELYDCPCPQTVGTIQTKPNGCNRACNAAPQLGASCAGGLAVCTAGANVGKNCDEQSDCPGGACANPTPADCVNGLCVPLCLPDPSDPEEGLCSAGPTAQRCNGLGHHWRICTSSGQSCSATCSVSGGPCSDSSACPVGESCTGTCDLARNCEAGIDGILGNSDDTPGAGFCEIEQLGCFLPVIQAEGGDRLNGQGDPNVVKSATVFCLGTSGNNLIDGAAGLPGPARLRQRGVNATNGFTSLP